MQISKTSIKLAGVYLLIISAPPILFSLLNLKGMAIGTTLVSVFAMIISRGVKLRKIKRNAFLILTVLVFYAALQHIANGFWTAKAYLSIPALALIVVSAKYCSLRLLRLKQEALHGALLSIGLLGVAILFINHLLSYQLGLFFGYANEKAVFPFLEPSHSALALGPVFLANIAVSKHRVISIFFILASIFASFFIPSATFLPYALIGLAVHLIKHEIKLFPLSFPAIIFPSMFVLATVLSNPYLSDRLNLSSESDNLSVLVYLQGIDDAINSLRISGGLGLGFQMLGTQPPSTYAIPIERILGSTGGELNREDGSFLAAKLIAETGLLGLLLIVMYFVIAVKGIKSLINTHRYAGNQDLNLTCCALVLGYSVEMFVRGYGYFSPGFFVFLIAVFSAESKELKKSLRLFRHT